MSIKVTSWVAVVNTGLCAFWYLPLYLLTDLSGFAIGSRARWADLSTRHWACGAEVVEIWEIGGGVFWI